MAAFNRLTEATYEVHESVKVDTQDNEDHTFCGIMFPVKCKELLPVDHISIRSVAVRGELGPLTVWVSKEPKKKRNQRSNNNTNNNNNNNTDIATSTFRLQKSHWHKVYQAVHPPSPHEYSQLVLQEPIILKPGQVRAIYIHSTLPNDRAIVYDNAAFYMPRRLIHFGHGHHHRAHHANNNNETRKPRYEDAMMAIYSGRAHVSTEIFGQEPIWGWGNAWRDHREFVGQVEYGAVYQLWNPERSVLTRFGPKFQEALFNLKLCQTRWESPMSRLPDECIYYILNMCRWDWFADTPDIMNEKRQVKRAKARQERRQLREQQRAAAAEEEAARERQQQQAEAEAAEQKPRAVVAQETAPSGGGVCCCNHNSNNNNDDDSDAHYADAVEEEPEEVFDDAMMEEDQEQAVAQEEAPAAGCNKNDAEEKEEEEAALGDNTNDDADVDPEDDDDDDDDDASLEEAEPEVEYVRLEEVVDAAIEELVGDDDDEEDEDFETTDDDDDDEEEEDEDDDDDSAAWERANGYRADHNVFRFVDPDAEQDDDDDDDDNNGNNDNNQDDELALRQAWIRRQFDRINVLRALARAQDDEDMEAEGMEIAF